MAKSTTPSFILELPLQVDPKQEKTLLARFEAARQVYNACLGESLKRLDLLKQSRAYQHACRMPKREPSERKERAIAFRDAERAVGMREYDVMSWATQFTHSWLRDHVASQEVKAVVRRAFSAVRRYQFGTDKPCRKTGRCTKKKKNCAVCGRPRFKRYGEIDSVENITNAQGLRWRDEGCYVQWRDLKLYAVIDLNDLVQQHGLAHRVKYVRVVKRVMAGRNRFYAQLVLEGKPLPRVSTVDGAVVGLDIGPSTIAVVGEENAFLVQFCAELEDISVEIRVLQRKMDRQRRANNPQNYNDNGTVKRGPSTWHKSNRMLKTEARLAELQRRQVAYRKSLHGRLVNRVLELGNIIKTEKLSYRAFQRQWGKSVGARAPGMFVARLRQKADLLNGCVQEFSTYTTRLSQVCHNCGTVDKKPLSQRWHECDCGIVAQRDLYSAFLASCVELDTLDADLARERWSTVGSLLQAAFREIESANGRAMPASVGLGQRNSGLPA